MSVVQKCCFSMYVVGLTRMWNETMDGFWRKKKKMLKFYWMLYSMKHRHKHWDTTNNLYKLEWLYENVLVSDINMCWTFRQVFNLKYQCWICMLLFSCLFCLSYFRRRFQSEVLVLDRLYCYVSWLQLCHFVRQ